MPRSPWKPTNGIKFHRLRLGLTQAELAARVGVGVKYISYWERWHEEPSAEKRAKLAEVLGCSEVELLEAIAPAAELKVDEHKMRRGVVRRPARYWMEEQG